MARIKELVEEFKLVFTGRGGFIDTVLPPLLFLIVNAIFGFTAAMWASLGLGAALTFIRLIRKQSWTYALGGIGGAGLAVGLVLLFERSEVYFLPTLVSSAFTVIALLVSLLLKKALAAYSSHISRGWPIEWYWHERVYPAYKEVTVGWLLYSVVKLVFQVVFFMQGELSSLTWLNTLLGWPALVLVLAGSYVYGLKRLSALKGPSVEEFIAQKEPPWEGQQRGF